MSLEDIHHLIAQARRADWNDTTLSEKTIELAEKVLYEANASMKVSEKKQAAQLARMMNDPAGKALTLTMADRVFRPTEVSRSAEQFRHLVRSYGVPLYLSSFDRLAMRVGVEASAYFPHLVMPAVTNQLRKESSTVILPSENNLLYPHLKERKKEGIRMNINQLGEAILGETEAAHRLRQVIERLKDPHCDYISVKISSIFSQIHLIAFEETVRLLQERLRQLYRTAIEHGKEKPKFVNLDMEEYRDLHLTCEAFKRTLMEDEFMHLEAGIVLQAYLPDSWEEQQKLCAWAKERVEHGGARIKIRLVKGANLAMEKVEAALHDWEQAPYETKDMVDANFKRMLHYGCAPEHATYVQFGVASHNIFDLCYTLLLRQVNDVKSQVELEMLEGMANHQARVIKEAADGLLLYAPVVRREDFHSAIAYLVRRLDENTSEENFLHDLFGMTYGSDAWISQKNRFLKSCRTRDITKFGPNRKQNRKTDEVAITTPDTPFYNEQDTDWALRHNAEWMLSKIAKEKASSVPDIPLVINGEEKTTSFWGVGRDPSDNNKEAYKFAYSDFDCVEEALACAERARESWSTRSIQERAEIMHKVAHELGKMRGEAIAAMVRDAGKVPSEGDVEVSEALDFCRYYAEGMTRPGFQDGVEFSPLGTVCVIPPWNFPFAIPCGGVAAALMSGNTVIFKPASPTVYTAWLVAQAFWNAGVPKDVLQFCPTPPNEVGQKLVSDPRISAVILTGSFETGMMFKSWRPDLPLFAETSGKDSLIITATADPDQAVKDLVKSAFGHSGQKCSAASLAIVEASVYDNPAFLRQLKDAVASLKVGGAWEISSIVTPTIRPPEGALLRGLTQLEPGETWLLKPEPIDDNPCLWSPGIRLGVKPGSWFHKTECFGPVLGLIRAKNLKNAIEIQNDSDFGLTGGIHSLDEREIALWKSKVQVGNAYINRAITGAIVRRQPFGGWKKSSIGPGAKAGGPNYLTMLGMWKEVAAPIQRVNEGSSPMLIKQLTASLTTDAQRISAAAGSIAKWWNEEFGKEHDPSQVHGESNIFRYIPESFICLRGDEDTSDSDLAIAILIANKLGSPLQISLPSSREWLTHFHGQYCDVLIEEEDVLIERLSQVVALTQFLRAPGASATLISKSEEQGLSVISRPILANARIEMLAYMREQAVSETLHRYGNIIPKASEFQKK